MAIQTILATMVKSKMKERNVGANVGIKTGIVIGVEPKECVADKARVGLRMVVMGTLVVPIDMSALKSQLWIIQVQKVIFYFLILWCYFML